VIGIVNVLIADIRGYTAYTLAHGDGAAARLTAAFSAIAREVAAAHGGQVIELRGDEALAVFASARQALTAAVELQARFLAASEQDAALPLRVGIGLDAGEAVPVDGGFRGAALNLAARLCSLAGPGKVLASDAITHLAGKVEGLEYVEQGPVPLKGFAEPVRVARVRRAVSPQTGSSAAAPEDQRDAPAEQRLVFGAFLGSLPSDPLVARERELEAITGLIDRALAGEGRTVLLAGEPGAGKTRLAQETTLRLRDRGFLILAGRSYDAEQTVPYYPFLDALAAAHAHAPAALRREALQRWPYLGVLLPDQPGVAALNGGGQDEQQRVFFAATAFIHELAEAVPVALLLDDLHWADSVSLKLLLHLVRHTRAAPVFILATYRDVEVGRQHPLEGVLRELSREGLMERVSVRRLDSEGTRALIAAAMDVEAVSDDLTALVHGRTEGNPFFVQQVVRMLVERGDIFRQDGRWDRRRIDQIEVPESIRSVIGQRLGRLHDETQAALLEASVLGQTFAFADLLAMSGRSEDDLEQMLDEAAAAGLVRSADGESYSFDHALTQQALYHELAPRRRRRLHQAAGEAIEQAPERKRERRIAELAWHFLQADDENRALRYSLLAGDRDAAAFAHGEAEIHFAAALELARERGDQARQAEAALKLGGALRGVARYDEAAAHLEEALLLYRALRDRDGETRTMAEIGRLAVTRYKMAEGAERIEAFLAEADFGGAAPPSAALGELWAVFATLLANQTQPDNEGALAAAGRAADIARALGDEYLLAGAEQRRGLALFHMSRLEEARSALQRAILLAEAANSPEALMHALNNLACTDRALGDLTAFRPYHQRAFEIAGRIGDPHALELYAMNLGGDGETAGDLVGAREEYRRAVQTLRHMGAERLTVRPLAQMGWLSIWQGKVEEGLRALDEAAALAGNSHDLAGVVVQRAWLDAWEGRADTAVRRVEPLLSDSELGKEPLLMSLVVLGEAYLCRGDDTKALELIARARAQAALLGEAWIQTIDRLTSMLDGMLQGKRGLWTEAASSFDRALASIPPGQEPLLEILIRYRYGQMWRDAGDVEAARAELQRAQGLARRIGAGYFEEKSARELAALGSRSRSSDPMG
jgi:class 3 adenylate cyclase/tetratricopeptide (TPR) repeat protein